MNFIHCLPMMLAQLIILALAASVPAGGLAQRSGCDCSEPLIPHDGNEKKNRKALAWIPLYIFAPALLLAFIPWLLWRIMRNWGSWKIHTKSPRPQYIRRSFGWVESEKWKQKEAMQAKRKEARRDQHPIYRTTKANYKWIFHDPTGQLQQRFNQQKERSYLRFLPSWMRSYPHGTLQSGMPAQQSEASNENHQLPKLHVNDNSCLSDLETCDNNQFDGSHMSGALPDPYYPWPKLSKMDYHGAITRNTSGENYSLPTFPVMDEPDVVQVWLVGGYNVGPPRTSGPLMESEGELRGERMSNEEMMRRGTERRLEIGAYNFGSISHCSVSNPESKDTLR